MPPAARQETLTNTYLLSARPSPAMPLSYDISHNNRHAAAAASPHGACLTQPPLLYHACLCLTRLFLAPPPHICLSTTSSFYKEQAAKDRTELAGMCLYCYRPAIYCRSAILSASFSCRCYLFIPYYLQLYPLPWTNVNVVPLGKLPVTKSMNATLTNVLVLVVNAEHGLNTTCVAADIARARRHISRLNRHRETQRAPGSSRITLAGGAHMPPLFAPLILPRSLAFTIMRRIS